MNKEYRKLYDAESDKVAVEAFLNGPDFQAIHPDKRGLLRRYAEGEPMQLHQFIATACPDDLKDDEGRCAVGDSDGHSISWGIALGLRGPDSPTVRVQIIAGTPAREALLMLEKLTAIIRSQADEAANAAFKCRAHPVQWSETESEVIF